MSAFEWDEDDWRDYEQRQQEEDDRRAQEKQLNEQAGS